MVASKMVYGRAVAVQTTDGREVFRGTVEWCRDGWVGIRTEGNRVDEALLKFVKTL